MARRKVILPNWSVSKEMAQNREGLETNFSGLTVGELVINTTSGITSLATLDNTDTPVIFESSAMIDKRLEGFLDNVHKHTNKEVLDGITSGMVESWNNAEANAVSSSKTYTDNQINFVLCGATEAFDTLKEVEEWVESHSGETINIIKGINSLSGNVSALTQYILDNERTISEALNQLNDSAGFNANGESILPKKMDLSTAILTISGIVVSLKNISHTHENKEVLDEITSEKVSQWDAAEPNVITEISAVTKDNSNVISVNGKKVTIDLTNVGDENVIETIKVNNSALTVSNKTVNVDLSYLETAIKDIELTPGPNGITPVFTAITANVNNATGVPYVSVTSAKTDGEKYALTFDFQNLKGEKGDRGDDGTSVKILGTKHSYNELPSSNNANGDGYIIGENLYVWNGSTWVDVGQIKGPQGDPGTNAYISAVTASVGNTTGTPSVDVTTAGTPSNISFNLAFNGLKGSSGNDGIGIKSFVRTNGNGAAGSTDTYTITFTNGETSAITVYNGSDGKNGASGAAGTNGSTWYNGITEPSTGTGVDGDWYINTSTWNVYHKESNSWVIKGNIKGETGSFDDSALSSYALKSEIPDISGKVDKVDGKGLSTNDFTNDLKNKLDGIAAGAEVNVQSDWNATSGDALILNKPSLATVATSGSYNDLTNKPTLFSGNYNDLNNKPNIPDISGIQSKLDGIAEGAEVNVQSDWNETTTTSDAYIKNKPTLATVATSGNYNDLSNKPSFAAVATSGNYNDLTNRPTIPSVDGFIKNISLDTSTETLYIVGSTSKTGSTASLNTSSTDIYMQGGEIYAASDETLKNFGENIEVDFDKLAEIPKVYYTWKTDVDNKQQIGTSAQKLKEIYPELVSESEDGKLAVSYEKLSIIALAAVDKLYKENEELKDRLKRIEEKLGL